MLLAIGVFHKCGKIIPLKFEILRKAAFFFFFLALSDHEENLLTIFINKDCLVFLYLTRSGSGGAPGKTLAFVTIADSLLYP